MPPTQERAVRTRARLVDAAVQCLLEGGYAATSVGAVQERAGVARGTLLHHFPTRASLMAAVAHDVASRRLGVLRAQGEPAGAGWPAAVDVVWRDLRDPAFLAVLELWVAARTDADLRDALVPVQAEVFGAVHRAVADLAGDDDLRVPSLAQFTIDLLTGVALSRLLDADAPHADVVVERWLRALPVLLGRAEATAWLERP